MLAVEFGSSIRAALSFLDNAEIVRTVSSNSSLNVSPAFNVVALDSEQTYQAIYMRAVSLSYYNVMLSDFSVFQFSWSSLDSWRLAYLPNPWTAGVAGAEERIAEWEALEALGGYDAEEVSMLIAELPYYGSIPPVRFEYAANQYREISHPAAHLHIGRDTENRWALSKLLNPLTFSMLVTKLYYADRWSIGSEFFGGPAATCYDREFIRQLGRSRFVHDFTAVERTSLHFSSR